MMKKLNDNVLQFDDVNEMTQFCIENYLKMFQYEIDVNIIEMYCFMNKRIKQSFKKNEIIHILLYDDCFVVYDNKNVAHEYVFNENDILFDCCEHFENFEHFLKYHFLYYIDDVLQMHMNETKIFDCV